MPHYLSLTPCQSFITPRPKSTPTNFQAWWWISKYIASPVRQQQSFDYAAVSTTNKEFSCFISVPVLFLQISPSPSPYPKGSIEKQFELKPIVFVTLCLFVPCLKGHDLIVGWRINFLFFLLSRLEHFCSLAIIAITGIAGNGEALQACSVPRAMSASVSAGTLHFSVSFLWKYYALGCTENCLLIIHCKPHLRGRDVLWLSFHCDHVILHAMASWSLWHCGYYPFPADLRDFTIIPHAKSGTRSNCKRSVWSDCVLAMGGIVVSWICRENCYLSLWGMLPV